MSILFSLIVGKGFAQEELMLYANRIPNTKEVEDTEYIIERGKGDRAIFNTSVPTLTVVKPTSPNGKCVIICPGGGYVKSTIDKEGLDVASRLVQDSITAFVLKYRIPQDQTNIDKSLAPLQDAQHAIKYVRENASFYNLNKNEIGIMGFSAGGHLAASAATKYERFTYDYDSNESSDRPDFLILVYPVISFKDDITHKGSREQLLGSNPPLEQILEWSCELNVTSLTPPTFLVHASDDKSVVVENSLLFYKACIQNDVFAEMHIYQEGGHGFGLHNIHVTDKWIDRLINWLKIL